MSTENRRIKLQIKMIYKKALEYYNKVKSLDENYNNIQYYEEYCLNKINHDDNLQKEIKYYYDKTEAFFEIGKYQRL
ncbi:hypothetical protein [Brachyspira alvinipulli]|uniref:hypothetical protein n=1 Tax=Brachyspira alvinipulli TaxID=84379 RepID=UPI0012EBA552|nr:hypothetical protein [Brachyspira alvinipulli]